MAILKIARMGHPVLRRVANPVDDPSRPEIATLIGNMVDTLDDIGGIGLAAPQVHVPLRVVIFHLPSARAAAERYRQSGLGEDGEEVPLTVLINPEIEFLGEAMNKAYESCLSVPGMTGQVARYSDITYRGLAQDGSAIDRTVSGFHARLLQHECDHLDGILYPQRMDNLTTFGYSEDVHKSLSESE